MTTPLTALGAATLVTVNYATPANPQLEINYTAINTAGAWTTVPTATGVQDLDPWLVCMLQKLADWNSSINTEVHDVVVSQPFVGVASRNNIDNRLTFTYTVTVYQKTGVAGKPDADLVVA
jgi:hypothetical protein